MHIPSHLSIQMLVGISTLFTILTPYLAAVFTQDHLKSWQNELIAVLVSVAAGVVSFVLSGGSFNTHDSSSLCLAISGVLVGAKLYYAKLLPNSPLIKKIEEITTFTSTVAGASK